MNKFGKIKAEPSINSIQDLRRRYLSSMVATIQKSGSGCKSPGEEQARLLAWLEIEAMELETIVKNHFVDANPFKGNQMNLSLTTIPEVRLPKFELYKFVRSIIAETRTALLRAARWFAPQNDLSYKSWRQLEYRNEVCTRVGERMNPFSIR